MAASRDGAPGTITLTHALNAISSARETLSLCEETIRREIENIPLGSSHYHESAKKGRLFEAELADIARDRGLQVSRPAKRCKYTSEE
jgi:hypothetical protein